MRKSSRCTIAVRGWSIRFRRAGAMFIIQPTMRFIDDLDGLERRVQSWEQSVKNKAFKTFRRIEVVWRGQAVKRVPVDTSTLKQHIIGNTFWSSTTQITVEVGTNIFGYPDFLEFGTDRIAGGAVKALGLSPDITDSMAVHTWPAKEGEASELTSHSYKRIDGGGILRNSLGARVGGPQEQMPWLRPAFNSISIWAQEQISGIIEIPRL